MAQKVGGPREDEGIIKIMPKAYITMVKHVLMYGNKALGPKSVEVMGICMGKEEGDDIIVYEAVPVSHGSSIEVGFTEADYAAFAQIDEEYSKKGLYAVGWYHSHPGMKAFFSKVDIKNQLFYQKEQTPKGFGLVFDHEYFDEDGPEKIGFKAFRLDDFRKGTASDFHEVKAEVLLPEDPEIYREIMYIIEAWQMKKPIVEEIGGLDVDESVWSFEEEEEGGEMKEKEEEEEEAEEEISDEELDKDFARLGKVLMRKFVKMFREFRKDTETAVFKGANVMGDFVAAMRETVETGIGRVRKYLEEILHKEVENIQNSIEEMFKDFDKDQGEFARKFDEFIGSISEKLAEIIGNLIGEQLDPVIQMITKAAEYADTLGKSNTEIKKALEEQKSVLESLKEALEKETDNLGKVIKEVKEKVGSEAEERSKMIVDALKDIREIAGEIDRLINDMGKKLSS